MKARTVSTLLLWTLTIIVIVYLKTFGLATILALLSAAAIFEACEIAKGAGLKPSHKSLQILNAAIFAGAWALPHFGIMAMGAGALVFALSLGLLFLSLLKNPEGDFAVKSFLPSAVILAAIPFMLQWLAALGTAVSSAESEYTGIVFALWIIAAAKFSDIGAYVIGKGFGKRKLAPKISPNKTLAGAFGGIFSSAALSAGIAWLCAPMLPPAFNIWAAAPAGAVIACAAIVSDLVESVYKRRANVKDSGAIIPGIGGALDLADSLLLSAPTGTIIIVFILPL